MDAAAYASDGDSSDFSSLDEAPDGALAAAAAVAAERSAAAAAGGRVGRAPRAWDEVDEAAIEEQAKRLVGDGAEARDAITPRPPLSGATAERDGGGADGGAAAQWMSDMLGMGYVSKHGELLDGSERSTRLGSIGGPASGSFATGRLSDSDRRRSSMLTLDIMSAGPRSSIKERDRRALLASRRLAEVGGTTESLLPASGSFDANIYLASVHSHSTESQLGVGTEALRREMRERTGQLKDLVKDNFERFISCKNTIDTIHNKLVEKEQFEASAGTWLAGGDFGRRRALGRADSGGHSRTPSVVELPEQSALAASVGTAHDEALEVFTPLLDRQAQAERIKSALGVLRRYDNICSLPQAIREHAASGNLVKLAKDYRKVISICPRDVAVARRGEDKRPGGTRLLGKIRTDADAAVDDACAALASSLHAAEIETSEAVRALVLLRDVAAARAAESARRGSSSRRALAMMSAGNVLELSGGSSFGESEEAKLVDAFVRSKAARVEAHIARAVALDDQSTQAGSGSSRDPVAAGVALTNVLANELTDWWRSVRVLLASDEGRASFSMTVDFNALLRNIVSQCCEHLSAILEELSPMPTRSMSDIEVSSVPEGGSGSGGGKSAAGEATEAAAVAKMMEVMHALVAVRAALLDADMPAECVNSIAVLCRSAAEGTTRRAFARAIKRMEHQVAHAQAGARAWQALSLEQVISTASGGVTSVEESLFRVSALPVLAREACLEAAAVASVAVGVDKEIAQLARRCARDFFHALGKLMASLRPAVDGLGGSMVEAAELSREHTHSTLVLLSDVAFCRTQLVPELVEALSKLLLPQVVDATATEVMADEMTDGVDDALMALEETMMQAYLKLKVPAKVIATERFIRADYSAQNSSECWSTWPPPSGVRPAAMGLTDLLVEAHAETYACAEPFVNVVVGAIAVDLVKRLAVALQKGGAGSGLEASVNARLQLLLDASYLQSVLTDHQADDLDAAFGELRTAIGDCDSTEGAQAEELLARLLPSAIERTRLNCAALRCA